MPPMPLAHPLEPIPPDGLSLTPYAVGVLLVVVAVVAQLRGRAEDHRPLPTDVTPPPSRWALASQLVSLTALVLIVVASRFGDAGDPLRLPELLLGYVVWPALLVASAIWRVWPYVDPWAPLLALAGRVRGNVTTAAPDTRWAVLAAAVWAAFFARHATLGLSRSLGVLLAGYTVALAVGAVLLGPRWARSTEVFGALFGWLNRTGRRVTAWRPPAGAESVLALLLAAALVHRARVNRVYGGGELAGRPGTDTVLVVLALAAAIALAISGLEVLSRRAGAAGTVVAALVPAAAAVMVAALLRRTMVAVQLLPSRLGDPFSRGWDPFGGWGGNADLNPWGSVAQQAFAAAVLVAGHALGAWVAVRRTPDVSGRRPAVLALWAVGAGSTLVVLAQPPQPLGFAT